MKTNGFIYLILAITLFTTSNCNELKKIFQHKPGEHYLPPDLYLNGKDAIEQLSDERKTLFLRLQGAYTGNIKFTLDQVSGSILLMQLGGHSNLYSGTDHVAMSDNFLTDFLPLISPEINFSELKHDDSSKRCDDMHITYSRVVGETPVLGSTLTVRFARDGSVNQIENSLAPIAAKDLIDIEHTNLELNLDTLNQKVSSLLKEKVDLRNFPSDRIYVPFENNGKKSLEIGNEYLINDASGVTSSFLYLAAKNITIGPHTAGTITNFDSSLSKRFLPEYHLDKRTEIPDFITFRDMGGVKVEALKSERNPSEIVYRFLEHYPSLFHTGAPNCQYKVSEIMNFSELPQTSYVRMDQIYIGMPVFGAQLIFEIDSMKKVESVIGHVLSNIFIDPIPQIDGTTAISNATNSMLALATTGADRQRFSTYLNNYLAEAELGIFPGTLVQHQKMHDVLAYKVNLGLFTFFIDAKSGLTTYFYSNEVAALVVRDATALNEFQVPLYTEVNRDGIPENGGNTNADVPVAVTSLPVIASTYARFGWSGLDNSGGDWIVNTNVLFAVDPAGILPPCPNAFFNIVGDQAFFCLGEVVPDIVAHELTHGVIAHSAGLIPTDESGALNESYADIMAELIFPDPPAPIPTWIEGTGSVGGFRDLANPGLSTTPGATTMAGYFQRTGAGCTPANILSCDAGFVHRNSQINSLAYVLLADGNTLAGGVAIQPITAGIGRQKTRMIAFRTIRTKLTPWSLLIDSRLGAYQVCRALMNAPGGGALPIVVPGDLQTPTPFTLADLDQVHLCFQQVGLDPDLITGWPPAPICGIPGLPIFVTKWGGETTDNGCTVTNHSVGIITPGGKMTATFVPNVPVNYFGTMGVAITTGSIGTTFKTFTYSTFNIFGSCVKIVDEETTASPPAGTNSCNTPIGFVQLPPRESLTISHPLPWDWFGTDAPAGNTTTGMPATCVLLKTEIEIVDASGNVLAGPSSGSVTYSSSFWDWGVKKTATQTATIVTAPPGPPNLSATVNWVNVGLGGIRYRLVYTISQPTGTICGNVQ